jgi:orotate phosphoribosyltransferase
MARSSFADFILNYDIIGFFDNPVTLKSGRSSHFYVNWRRATTDAWLLDELTDYVAEFIAKSDLKWDCIYGVPEGASKTALITAFKLAKAAFGYEKGSHVLAMGRGQPKSHGSPEDRYFIGMPKGRTIVLEDTSTTGLSLIKTIKQLQAAEVDVTAAISITDRMEKREDGLSVSEAIAKECGDHITYVAMTRATDLLPFAALRINPSEKVRRALTTEFDDHGVAPINWSQA